MAKARKQEELPLQRRNRAAAVGRDATAIAHDAFARAGFADETLVLRWAEIVGPDVARMAQPFRLSDRQSGGVLTLRAEPAAAVFLQHESRALCSRINAYLGRPAVQTIRFVPGNVRVPRPERQKRATGHSTAPEFDPARRFEGPTRLKEALLAFAGTRRAPVAD